MESTKRITQKNSDIHIEVLNIPPTINTAYGRGSHGKRYLSAKGKSFKSEVELACRSFSGTLNTGLFRLTIIVQCRWISKSGSVLKKDISNRIKIAEDAVAKGLGVDDSYFFEVRALKIHSDEIERTIFIIEEIGGKDAGNFGVNP